MLVKDWLSVVSTAPNIEVVEDTPYGFRLRFRKNSYMNFNDTYAWREIKDAQ